MNDKQQLTKKLVSILLIVSLPIFMAASCGNLQSTPTEKNNGGNNDTHNAQPQDTLTTSLINFGIADQQAK